MTAFEAPYAPPEAGLVDYFRFTTSAASKLAEGAGLRVSSVEADGGYAAVVASLLGADAAYLTARELERGGGVRDDVRVSRRSDRTSRSHGRRLGTGGRARHRDEPDYVHYAPAGDSAHAAELRAGGHYLATAMVARKAFG